MEQPRPQPEASYTLIYLLLMATLSQAIGEVIRSPESDKRAIEALAEERVEVSHVRSFLNQTSRFMRWTPSEATAFLPQLLRSNSTKEPKFFVEEINDDLLISDLSSVREDYNFDTDLDLEDSIAMGFKNHKYEAPRSESKHSPDQHLSAKTGTMHSNESMPKVTQSIKIAQNRLRKDKEASTKRVIASPKTISIDRTSTVKHSVSDTQSVDQSTSRDERDKTKELAVKKVKTQKKRRRRPKRRRSKSGVLIYGIEDEQQTLHPFFAKLTEVKSKGRKVRIMHYGDSLIAGDYVTRTTRRLLQKTFGDAGHGYFLAGKGSRWYGRRWVKLNSKGKWTKKRFTRSKNEQGVFGLGGVRFTSRHKNASLSAKPTGTRIGGKVDQVEVHYLAQPQGGSFIIEVGALKKEVHTHSEVTQAKRIVIGVKAGNSAKTRVKLLGDGEVTLYGIVFERKRGGVVYDALGLEGARAKLLLKLFGPLWQTQIRQRSPDLVILHYGTNESQNSHMSMKKYKTALTRVVRRFKSALPHSACMLLSPMDRGVKDPETGHIQSMRIVAKIVKAQREVAAESGCAFWSTYNAMGGRGSMAKWYTASPKLAGGDLTHPTGRGANQIGAMFFAALMDDYQRYRSGE